MRKKARSLIPCFLCLWAGAGGRGRGRADTPTRPPDPTPQTRHPDPTTRPPDTPRQVQEMQANASRCKGAQADARGCKRMQAIKQGGRGKGGGARGKGVAALAKGRKRKKPWRFQRGLMLLRGLRRQGSFAPLARLLPPAPLTPPPSPLPPCFSGCIPLSFPFHSACAFPFHSACIPLSFPAPALGCRGVGWSGRGVGSVGSGRVVGSGCRLSPCPCPLPLPKDCPPPPLAPPPRGSGGCKVCAPLAFARGALFSLLTSEVGQL